MRNMLIAMKLLHNSMPPRRHLNQPQQVMKPLIRAIKGSFPRTQKEYRGNLRNLIAQREASALVPLWAASRELQLQCWEDNLHQAGAMEPPMEAPPMEAPPMEA